MYRYSGRFTDKQKFVGLAPAATDFGSALSTAMNDIRTAAPDRVDQIAVITIVPLAARGGLKIVTPKPRKAKTTPAAAPAATAAAASKTPARR